jgi:serine/threonine protein kinase
MSQTRYEILGTIGAGASSRVDKAHDTLIDRTVVLKTFATGFGSPELQKEFLREAQILGRLSHPNIISIYDLGTNEDGSAYLVTEYVPGKTLEAVMAESGRIPLARAGVWAGDLASALSRAHKAGVIHGDVKPANVFVTDDGQIKLGDFGIARFATQVSGAASLVGTPAYLSPEQIKGETQDHRSDIFSVGIVLYQLTTGVRPFDGSSVAAVCAQIVAKQPAPPSRYNPELPPEFDRIVMRCLAKNPADRYASGESLAASLYPFARNKPEPVPHRFHFSWFKGALRPAEAWLFVGTVAAALAAIPVGNNFYREHHRQPSGGETTQVSAGTPAAVPSAGPPVVNFSSPAAEESARSESAARKTAEAAAPEPPAAKTGSPPASGSPLAAAPRETARRFPASSGAEAPTRTLPASGSKPTSPLSRSAPGSPRAAAPAASLGIEIFSAIDGATLAVFVDQQLLATSALSITRPGETVRLDRPLPAGPHEFRVALYRQDKTLQIEKQGLAELEPGPSNQLTVKVVRRSKMLVKRNADLDILWPSAGRSLQSGPDPAPRPVPGGQARKGSTPLVAASAPSSQ